MITINKVKSDFISLSTDERVALRVSLGLHPRGDNDFEFLKDSVLLERKLGKAGSHWDLYVEAKDKAFHVPKVPVVGESAPVEVPKKRGRKAK